MKTKIFFTMCLLLSMIIQATGSDDIQNASEKNKIRVNTTTGVKTLTESFILQYEKENQGIKFELNELSGNNFEGGLQPGTVAIFAETDMAATESDGQTNIVIGRDVVVPVINSANPFFSQLTKNGVQPGKIAEAIADENSESWETLLGLQAGENSALHIFVLNDKNLTSSVAGFLNVSPALLSEIKLEKEALIEKIQTDPMAIGFVRLADILGTDNNLTGNLQFLPIDRNENGVLDYNEKIYANVNEFKRGVWIGKYPQLLITNIYAATSINANNQAVTGFINWVVTDGQKWMETAGYTELVYNERQLKLEKINPTVITTEPRETEAGNSFLVVIISLVAVVAGFVAFLYYFRTGKVKKAVLKAVPQLIKTLNEQTFEIPNGLFFDKSHTWIFMEKDGQVKIGIDDFIPKVTGRFTRVIMKNPGDTVKRKEPVVQLIQHGKQISIYSPVSGVITDFNEDLVTSPDTINNSPYEEGWIYQIEPSNWLRESSFFKLGLQYRDWIKSELTRLKDFVACSHNLQLVPNATVAYQEGGEITAQPLKEMSPELWEDFQTYFIDTADLH
ncbi:MAG TPA: hypothetical protein DER09_12490 [Prolixibacteraceae bacterium]|nr:hypothetical protein [Prolixibacteraceae bacterium]